MLARKGLTPWGLNQTIIWTSGGLWLIGTLRTYLYEILIKMHWFSLKKMNLEM